MSSPDYAWLYNCILGCTDYDGEESIIHCRTKPPLVGGAGHVRDASVVPVSGLTGAGVLGFSGRSLIHR